MTARWLISLRVTVDNEQIKRVVDLQQTLEAATHGAPWRVVESREVRDHDVEIKPVPPRQPSNMECERLV
jgi:hypothetical protein